MIDRELFRNRVERSLARHTTLTTIWGVIRRVQTLTSNPNSSSRDLVNVIGSDPVLTARVLSIVNSAAYGFPRQVNNLDEAVVILGYKQLRDLCTSIAAIRGLEKSATGNFNRVDFWKHSLGTATASRLIQSRMMRSKEPDLFVAGLLCNIGRIILDQDFPDEFSLIIRIANEKNIPLVQAESEVLGFTHADIGGWAADAWHLNQTLATAIKNHHGPGENAWECVINLAYVCTQALGIGSPGDPTLTMLIPDVFKKLELAETDVKNLLLEMDSEFAKMESFFKEIAV